MVRRAVKGNWDLPDGVLDAALASAIQMLRRGDARTKREALRFIKAVREQNVLGHRIDVAAELDAQTESAPDETGPPRSVEEAARMRAEHRLANQSR